MQYRAKSKRVDAWRFEPETSVPWWVFEAAARGRLKMPFAMPGTMVVVNDHGGIRICVGDYLIREPDGEIYGLSELDFTEQYEPVGEGR